MKNMKNTRHKAHKLNPGGHEVVRATIPAANLEFLYKISQFMDVSHKNT
jgi:hypothetical protein